MDNLSSGSQNPYASPAISTDSEQTLAPPSPNKPNEPLIEPIRFTGALSLEDFFCGFHLGRRKVRRLIILVALGVIFIWVIFSQSIMEGNLFPVVITSIIALAIWILAFAIAQAVLKLRFKRACTSGKGTFAPMTVVIHEKGYEACQETGESKVFWSAFSKYRHKGNVAILFIDGSPFTFRIFSRNLFQTQHDWDCFLGLLERKMPQG